MTEPLQKIRHLSNEDLAERLGVSINTVRYWRSTGQGPKGFVAGRRVRYRLEDVEAWENDQLAKESA